MTAEEKKEFVTRTWTAFGTGDIKGAFANMDDNVSWLIPGNLPGVSGLKKGKDEILKFISGVGAVFPEGLKSEFRRVYCDGDTVIVELTNRGKASNGKRGRKCYQVLWAFIRIMTPLAVGRTHSEFPRRHHNHLRAILGAFSERISRLQHLVGCRSEHIRPNLLEHVGPHRRVPGQPFPQVRLIDPAD